jgi:hypothetical protein
VRPVPLPVARPARVLLVLLAALTLAGCSSDKPATQAVFKVQDGVQPNAAAQACQLHQTQAPTSAYRGGPHGTTALELPFLASYTANGNKRYCDGKPPTGIDKDWARLYVKLTGNSAAVSKILSGS